MYLQAQSLNYSDWKLAAKCDSICRAYLIKLPLTPREGYIRTIESANKCKVGFDFYSIGSATVYYIE